MQKYEQGINRISASGLFGIAAALQVPILDFFFDGPGTQPKKVRGTAGR
jgi:transcriptional regulator with XRE-family HTH domain